VDILKITKGNKVTSKKLPLGTYKVVETKAPNGYTINTKPQNVTLSYENQNVPLVSSSTTIKNDAVKGNIEITKQDEETGNTPQGTGTFTGAEFEIRDANGKVVDKLKIEKGNKTKSKDLVLGDYTVVETKAPNGYLINKKEHPVSLTYKNQHTALVLEGTTVKDKAVLGKIKVIKEDEETGDKPSGRGTLTGAEFDIKDKDGKVVDQLKITSGNEVVSKPLVLGTYTVVETKAPDGYLINTKPHKVTLKYEDEVTPIVYSSRTVKDKPVKGQVHVWKEDAETGKTPQGDAKLGNETVQVIDMKGKVVDEGKVPHGEKWTSKKLPLGDYIVKEIKQGEGYLLQTKEYPVSLVYKNEVTPVVFDSTTVKNEVIKAPIELEKYTLDADENGSGHLTELEGAEFTFTLKSSGKVMDKVVTDKNGYAKTKDLPYGTYVVKETKAPQGFMPVKDFEVNIKEHQKVYTHKLVDGTISMPIKIIKQDKDTGKVIPLAGTTFKIKDLAKDEFITQKIKYPTPMELTE